jgi:hypothetical protein
MVPHEVNGLAARMAAHLGYRVDNPKTPRSLFWTVHFDTEEDVAAFSELFTAWVHELQREWRRNLWGI